jgi:flagellar basal-body rod modification protein FlgD
MSLASVASAQSTAAASAASSSGSNASTASQVSSTALSSLTSNFGDFLNLLMTQLQNQDPTSPMDTNQFTSELVQFAGVEQQINTNTSLTQLIQLTQAGEVMQSSAMVGKQVTVTANQLALQNGQAKLNFTGTAGQNVAIGVYNAAGAKIRDASLVAQQGSNSWTWDGTDNSGNQMPDGAYTVAVEGATASGTTALPFTVTGTATGVQKGTNSMTLNLGALSVDFSAVQSVQ